MPAPSLEPGEVHVITCDRSSLGSVYIFGALLQDSFEAGADVRQSSRISVPHLRLLLHRTPMYCLSAALPRQIHTMNKRPCMGSNDKLQEPRIFASVSSHTSKFSWASTPTLLVSAPGPASNLRFVRGCSDNSSWTWPPVFWASQKAVAEGRAPDEAG